ncbi:MAG: hypothetical protein CBE00_13945 [Planctomycetaceae bacterium TMED240]|nr:MAG: hypothetical protein CBE00_13945 [Planctomycetaceae bacterium TMED240]
MSHWAIETKFANRLGCKKIVDEAWQRSDPLLGVSEASRKSFCGQHARTGFSDSQWCNDME